MNHIVEFKYELRERVLIPELKVTGIIRGMALDGDGRTYRVVFWWDGNRKSEWLLETEIVFLPIQTEHNVILHNGKGEPVGSMVLKDI